MKLSVVSCLPVSRVILRCVLMFGVVAFFLVFIGCEATLDESLIDLQAGDCVEATDESGVMFELNHTDCSDPGVLRVTKTFEITEWGVFPGAAMIDQFAQGECGPTASWWLVPTEESWNEADDRLVVCFAE